MTSAGIRGVEPMVVAIVDRLQSKLAAEIEVANQDQTDGVELDMPVAILSYVPPVVSISDFPTIGIQHGNGALEDDNAWTATEVFDLTVVSFLQDADQLSLTMKIRRWDRTIKRVLLAGRQILPAIWGMTMRDSHFGPSLAEINETDGPPHTYYTWCAVTVRCRGEAE